MTCKQNVITQKAKLLSSNMKGNPLKLRRLFTKNKIKET